MKTGEDVVDALYVRDLFEEAGIEVIPTIYADGRAGGRVTREAFDFILEQFLNGVREHIDEIDGMFFFLHGASNVLGLEGGSGEHTIIREIRKLIGPYLPIAMVMDPHGNLSQEQADNCQIIRTFRHSPHTDRPDWSPTGSEAVYRLTEQPPRHSSGVPQGSDFSRRGAQCFAG